MSQRECRRYVGHNGCALLNYEEAHHAVLRLPDGRRVAFTVGMHNIEVRQTRGFFDLFFGVNRIGSWDLPELRISASNSGQLPRQMLHALMLDILIQRVSHSRTLNDVCWKASTGALDPYEDVEKQCLALLRQT